MFLFSMNSKINDNRIIRANNLHEIQTFVDSYHSVHMDMRGHTGGVSTFCIGCFTAKSSKQKMNLIGSDESEVKLNIRYLPYNILYE